MVRVFVFIFLVRLFLFSAYAQEYKVSIVRPVNLSGDEQINWLSDTFARSIYLEMRKERFKASIVDKIPEKVSDDEFLVISAFKKSKERILFYTNIVKKGSAPVVNSDNTGIIDTFTLAFIPETVYEAKTYISRIVRLYISASARISEVRFKPIEYKYNPEQVVAINEIAGKIISGDFNIDMIIFSPAEYESWFNLGVKKIKDGNISDGVALLIRYVSKVCPTFSSEEEVLKDERIKRISEVLEVAMPGKSPNRKQAIQYFIISQFYGDFSDNETKNLEEAIKNDPFFWPAMKKLGYIYFAKGDYRSSLSYFRDYISTANEGLDFIKTLVKPISLVEELSRGF